MGGSLSPQRGGLLTAPVLLWAFFQAPAAPTATHNSGRQAQASKQWSRPRQTHCVILVQNTSISLTTLSWTLKRKVLSTTREPSSQLSNSQLSRDLQLECQGSHCASRLGFWRMAMASLRARVRAYESATETMTEAEPEWAAVEALTAVPQMQQSILSQSETWAPMCSPPQAGPPT